MTGDEAQAKAQRRWGGGAYVIGPGDGHRCVVGCSEPDVRGVGETWEEAFASAIENEEVESRQ